MGCVMCSYRRAAFLALKDSALLLARAAFVGALPLLALSATGAGAYALARLFSRLLAMFSLLTLPLVWWDRLNEVVTTRANARTFGDRCPGCGAPLEAHRETVIEWRIDRHDNRHR